MHPANAELSHAKIFSTAMLSHVRQRLGGSPTIVPLGQKSRIRANYRHTSSMMCLYANPPDISEWMVWRRHLTKDSLFVDAGANVGAYSILAAELGARVIAFEPNDATSEELRTNVRINGYESQVTVRKNVLSDKPEQVLFTNAFDSMNHLVGEAALDEQSGHSLLEAVVLDDVISSKIRGLKVDVEGAELMVLQGAATLLASGQIELIQLEWNEQSQNRYGTPRTEIGSFLNAYGYETFRPVGTTGYLESSDMEIGSDIFAAQPARIAHLMKDAT